ncbi:uncharacterized protein BX664DRAFT_327982 [Halteromyces radiatus]|uniref:uncharacterized protein n=1 Tax=Halteromyces radiatus TaxID=101107 RepID=UPI00221F36F7|nr:uncharacterized protein BX664DRAFT_327982 [Halteromyces radiatus]KAI8092727.1 hypothetical protein BX664DRAFT_327982 [Halteromyces radiatus]
MFNSGNHLWLFIGVLSIIAYPLYHLHGLAGINKVIPSVGRDTCVKIASPENFSFCEDIVLGNDGIAYASCDPARAKRNKVLDYNYFTEGEVIPSGDIWQIDYTTTPPKVKSIATNSRPTDFHPLGLAVDPQRRFLLAINLPFESDKSLIEVFTIQEDGSLVHHHTIQHDNIYTPNSLHLVDNSEWQGADGTPSFFFSNDHYFDTKFLKLIENTAILPISNVMFYDARSKNAYPVIHGLAFANGVSGDNSTLFVSECNKRRVHQYNLTLRSNEKDINKAVHLEYVQNVNIDMAVDNLDFDPSTGKLVVAGHPKGLDFMQYAVARDRSDPSIPRAASQVVSWTPSQGEVKTLFSDDGHYYAASTTGALDVTRQKLLISSLYDHGILVCDA